jgi:hypothetical protein
LGQNILNLHLSKKDYWLFLSPETKRNMKGNKNFIWVSLGLFAACTLYRVFPHPGNFAPQIAMALFGGAMVKDRKLSFLFPLISMFISDLVMQALHSSNPNAYPIQGFYAGQWVNYLLIAATTIFGFGMRSNKLAGWLIGFVGAPTVYFLLSNFTVWLGGGGWSHPTTFDGLILTYEDGLPFYGLSLISTAVFGAIFFGAYNFWVAPKTQTA